MGNARQFAKQTRSCSCKPHWVLHCSPSHFRKLKCDLLARAPATAAGGFWAGDGRPTGVIANKCSVNFGLFRGVGDAAPYK